MGNVTKAQATKVLELLKAKYASEISESNQPKLYVPGFHADSWVIGWDGGPYEWPYVIDELKVSKTVWLEAMNSWSISIVKA